MRKTIIITLILVVVSTSMCIQKEVKGTYDMNYGGYDMMFASDLERANNVSVLPDENALRQTLFSYDVAELQLAYYHNDTEAAYYIKSLTGFASKYVKMNIARWDYDMSKKMKYIMLNDTSELPNATVESPAIIIMGPAFGKNTHIVVEDNIVKVYANDLTPKKGKYVQYNDFDLALDKIILTLTQE